MVRSRFRGADSERWRMRADGLLLCRRLLVGAPWDGPPNNRKGDIYKCIVGKERNSTCSKMNLGERIKGH